MTFYSIMSDPVPIPEKKNSIELSEGKSEIFLKAL